MPVNVRAAGDVAVLSNFGPLMDDPRHFDASRDVQELVDAGYRKFILELRGVGRMGPSGIGLLVTVTRVVRKHEGELVLAGLTPAMRKQIDELRLDEFWDVYASVDDALERWRSDRLPAGRDAVAEHVSAQQTSAAERPALAGRERASDPRPAVAGSPSPGDEGGVVKICP